MSKFHFTESMLQKETSLTIKTKFEGVIAEKGIIFK